MRSFVLGSIAAMIFAIVLDRMAQQRYPVHVAGGIIVTGASSGIGRDAAERLAKEGFVVYAGVRKQADMDSLKGINNLVPVKLDVTDQESIDKCFSVVSADLSTRKLPLVGLVNNAGINTGSRVMEFYDLKDAEKVFDVNYFGVLKMTQKVLPSIRASQGRIIQVSSIGGLFSSALFGAYSGSKFAIDAFSDTLRVELLVHNVSVSTINPCAVKSNFQKKQKEQNDAFNSEIIKQEMLLYGNLKKNEEKNIARVDAKAESPRVTSDAILHAMVDPFPKTNYVVSNLDGMPGWLFYRMTQLLPKRLMDKIILSSL